MKQLAKRPSEAKPRGPGRHLCLCGRLAFKKRFGAWACERCLRIEHELEGYKR